MRAKMHTCTYVSAKSPFPPSHPNFNPETPKLRTRGMQAAAESLTMQLQALEKRAAGATMSAPMGAASEGHVVAGVEAANAKSNAGAAAAPAQESLEQLAARLTGLVADEKYDDVFAQVRRRIGGGGGGGRGAVKREE